MKTTSCIHDPSLSLTPPDSRLLEPWELEEMIDRRSFDGVHERMVLRFAIDNALKLGVWIGASIGLVLGVMIMAIANHVWK